MTVEIIQGRTFCWTVPESIEDMILSGGFPNAPTWGDYLIRFDNEVQWRLVIAHMAVVAGKYIGETGESFANDHYFKFSDGKTLRFSWRAWGDFMQAIIGKREGYLAYTFGPRRMKNDL